MTEQQEAAMRQALEALEHIDYEDNDRDFLFPYQCTMLDNAITALRQALEQQPADEPVAWTESDWHYQLHKKGMVVAHKDKGDVLVGEPQPLYTRPQSAAWVDLTDEEFEQLLVDAKFTRSDLLMLGACVEDICNMVQAKLKEKNT